VTDPDVTDPDVTDPDVTDPDVTDPTSTSGVSPGACRGFGKQARAVSCSFVRNLIPCAAGFWPQRARCLTS
jgi:hypothetical protein